MKIIEDLPPVPEKVWKKLKQLVMICRTLRMEGHQEGTLVYEKALSALKAQLSANNLLLGHISAIEKELDLESLS